MTPDRLMQIREWWISPHKYAGAVANVNIGEGFIHVVEKSPEELLIGGHTVLIDHEDFAFLSRFNWSIKRDKNTFYAITNVVIGGKQTSVSMHRLISGLVSSEIDHKDRNGLNNRKINLRFATKAENQRNRMRQNSTGYRGVYKTAEGSFSAQIQIDGVKIHKHGFKTAEEAAGEYDKLSVQYHGDFGIRNFKD